MVTQRKVFKEETVVNLFDAAADGFTLDKLGDPIDKFFGTKKRTGSVSRSGRTRSD